MKKTNWKKLFLGTLGFAAAYVVIMSILFLISLHILGYIFLIYGQFILIGVLAYHAAKRTLNDSKNSRRDTIIFGFLLFFTAVLCMQFLTPVYLVLQNIIGWGVEVNFVEELSQSFEWHRLLMTFLGTWGIGVLFAVLTGVGTWYRSNVYDSLPKNQKKSEDNSLDSIIKKLSISAILVVFPGIALYLFLIDYFFGDPSWDVLILIFVLPALVIGLFLTHIAKTTNNKKLAVFLGIATLIWVLGIYGYGILERYNSTNGDDEIKLEDAGKLQSSTDSDYTDWPDADAYVQGYSYFDSQIVENSSIHYAVKFANEEIANIAQQYIDQNKLATFIYTTQSRGFGGEKYKRYWNIQEIKPFEEYHNSGIIGQDVMGHFQNYRNNVQNSASRKIVEFVDTEGNIYDFYIDYSQIERRGLLQKLIGLAASRKQVTIQTDHTFSQPFIDSRTNEKYHGYIGVKWIYE